MNEKRIKNWIVQTADDDDDLSVDFIDDEIVVGSLNQQLAQISPGRISMIATQLEQHFSNLRATVRKIKSGQEYVLAKECFDIRIEEDEDVWVRAILNKVQPDRKYIQPNPNTGVERILIYQCVESKKFGAVAIPLYMKNDAKFAFTMFPTKGPNGAPLSPGMRLPPQWILAQPYARAENGDLRLTSTIPSLCSGLFGTNEDGVIVSKSTSESFEYELVHEVEFIIEANKIGVNSFGTDENVMVLPVVGSFLDGKGFVCAIMENKKCYSLINRLNSSLSKVSRPFDEEIFSYPYGEVIGIEVIRGLKTAELKNMPLSHKRYWDNLADNCNKVHEDVLAFERQERRVARGEYSNFVKPSWYLKVRDAEIRVGEPIKDRNKPTLTMGDKAINGYYVKVTIRKRATLELGDKMAGIHGDKGVICEIRPDKYMPYDMHGVHAGFIFNPACVSQRAIQPVLDEMWAHAVIEKAERTLDKIMCSGGTYTDAFMYFKSMIKHLSPHTYALINMCTPEEKIRHIKTVLRKGIEIISPIGKRELGVRAMDRIMGTEHEPEIGYLNMLTPEGEIIKLVEPGLIAGKCVGALDKLASSGSACNIPLQSSQGNVAKLSSSIKRNSQIPEQAARLFGEPDFRDMVAKAGAYVVKVILTTHSNAKLAKQMAKDMLTNKVGFFDTSDETKYPKMLSSGLARMFHLFETYGFQLRQKVKRNKDEKPNK